MIGQQAPWACPPCGHLYLVADTGERITSRYYGTSRRMVFTDAKTGEEKASGAERCECGRFLHFLFNYPLATVSPDRRRSLVGAA
jgi:hypothetical protein